MKLILDDGRELTVTVTEEELKKLKEKKFDAFDVKDGEEHYYVESLCSVETSFYISDDEEKNAISCKDKYIMERRAMRQILNNRLEKYAYEHGALARTEAIYRNHKQFYTPTYFTDTEQWSYEVATSSLNPTVIYFTDKEICKQAITDVVLPFCEEYPDFV